MKLRLFCVQVEWGKFDLISSRFHSLYWRCRSSCVSRFDVWGFQWIEERLCELMVSVFPLLPSVERSHPAAERSGPTEAAPPGSQRLSRHRHAEEIRLSQWVTLHYSRRSSSWRNSCKKAGGPDRKSRWLIASSKQRKGNFLFLFCCLLRDSRADDKRSWSLFISPACLRKLFSVSTGWSLVGREELNLSSIQEPV